MTSRHCLFGFLFYLPIPRRPSSRNFPCSPPFPAHPHHSFISVPPLHIFQIMFIKNLHGATALVVQWLRLLAPKAGGSIPDGGTRIPQAAWHGLKKKKKKEAALCQPSAECKGGISHDRPRLQASPAPLRPCTPS